MQYSAVKPGPLMTKLMQEYKLFGFMKTALQTPTSAETLNSLRRTIWEKRTEFYYRKFKSIPDIKASAKVQAGEVYDILAQGPRTWTNHHLLSALFFSLQCYGLFTIGEIWGRQRIGGYNVGVHH